MSPVDTQSQVAGAKRRRTVRILSAQPSSRASTISLAVAIGAALMLLVLWRWWSSEVIPSSTVRTVFDLEWVWRCDLGHTFRAAGQLEPKTCYEGGTCRRPAYPVANYACLEHGTFAATVQFAADGDARSPQVSQVRLRGGKWVPVSELRCPRCSRRLAYRPPDPLAAAPNRRGARGD